MDRLRLPSSSNPLLDIQVGGGKATIVSLCAIDLAGAGAPARVQGSFALNTDSGRFEGADWHCAALSEHEGGAMLRQAVSGGALELVSAWAVDAATGVVSRNDSLSNTGRETAIVRRCLARFCLPAGNYEVYFQQSRWCNENQGAWQALRAGELALRCAPGRSAQGCTPYACIRNVETRRGLAVHVLPCGNWVIRFSAAPAADSLPFVAVELGLSDENLRLALRPGESLALPGLLFQELPGGEPHLAAPALHEHMLARHFSKAKPEAPVVYNTWFDEFELLDVPRLRRQLAAARAAGCEVFVIDAGWFGAAGASWWAQVGNWSEKIDAAFHGRMREFADEVRASGLGFGLWMEPERVGPEAPVRSRHPEWFVPAGASARFDLARPEAYAWLRGEIGRLVETYRLAWMKMDYNFEMDADSLSGSELSGYTALWRRMLDEIRAAYPGTFFEGCASGGLCLDAATLAHFDGHFLSDTIEPADALRISQGAFLRVPPGRITRWAGLRSQGPAAPRYCLSTAGSPDTVLVPGGALWEPAVTADLDFALLAAMPGMFGLTGDLAGLPPAVAARVREHVAFFKEWRRFIAGAAAHLLTTPELVSARSGWIAFQFQDPAGKAGLVFIYRLGVAAQAPRWRLRGLKPEARYAVRRALTADHESAIMSGTELMTAGFAADPASAGGSRASAAAVYVVSCA